MSILIDWLSKVITVHKADLAVVQLSPEIRQLNLGSFHLTLRALEAAYLGMPYPQTHTNVTPYVVGDVAIPRVMHFVNGYTITFENGDYTVWVVGGASNIQGVVTPNDVVVELHNDEPECVDIHSVVSNPDAPRIVNTKNLRPRIYQTEEL